MEILFYRYNSICEPDLIESFEKLGITVVEDRTQITEKNVSGERLVGEVAEILRNHSFLFVFSVNFFPALSEICELMQVPYIAWTVDVPIQELFSKSLENKCNRIFMFDKSQYLYFKDRNPEGIFYLPLATNTARWDKVISSASESERKKFSSDISFVGSLYGEKNPFRKIKGMDDYTKGYLQGVIEAQLQVYGENFTEKMISDEILRMLEPLIPDMHQPLFEGNLQAQRYLVAHSFVGVEIAQTERIRLLNALAKTQKVDLYTFSDTSELSNVQIHQGVKTLTEMPIVFNSSRINLNITMRPIATGLSLRVYDICGCGGFLMTNWQSELPDIYEPGVEAEYFTSEEELIDKAGYYLEHDEAREKIAHNGYLRTVKEHTYDHRIADMIRVVNSTL